MLGYYGVEIGRYSYGPCLWPGELPWRTRIKNFCSLAPGVNIFRRNHPAAFISLHPFFFNSRLGILDRGPIEAVQDNPVFVMDDAWVGANSIITPGCRGIGICSVVGSGTVVIDDVSDFMSVVNNVG